MTMQLADSADDIIRLALAEDIGPGDITTYTVVPPEATATGQFLFKQEGVLSGIGIAGRVFELVDTRVEWTPLAENGDAIGAGTVVATICGPAQAILIGERTALNLVQRLSGVATMTRAFVNAVAGTGARIVDTRKTTPGMRVFEKGAVRHGGGANHRFGLHDGILIKDNHIAAVGGDIPRAVARARASAPHTIKVEVEVTSLEQLEIALDAEADIVMLDNMRQDEMREAVARTAGRALLEASGGVRLDTVRSIAETGVDLISVGALTHSAPAVDISLELAMRAPES